MSDDIIRNSLYSAQQCGLNVIVCPKSSIDLYTTFNCGQTFRWRTLNTEKSRFCGTYKGHFLEISTKNGEIIFHNTNLTDFNSVWADFFALNEDYCAIKSQISQDKIIKKAIETHPGIRVLRQDKFETIITFIISANNNIRRITKIVEDLCRNFGECIAHFNGKPIYAFPTADVLANLTEADLAPIRAGYRAKYIIETAKILSCCSKCSEKSQKTIDSTKKAGQTLPNLKNLSSLDDFALRKSLQTLPGVGPKVADCIMLFAFNRLNICPEDVWMKRILAEHFGGKLPDCCAGYEGIAQQFLFHYFRNLG